MDNKDGYSQIPVEDEDEKDSCPVNTQRDIKQRAKQAKLKLYLATAICIAFIAAEVIGGFFSNSLAIITDAAHMTSDLASLITSIVAINIAAWPASKSHTFGFYRAEMIGAFLTILLGWIVAGVLTYFAIERIMHGEYEIESDTMLIISGFCLLANILMGVVLFLPGCHGHSHGPSHSHSHGSSKPDKRTEENINIRAAFIHILGDVLCTVGLLIAAVIIKLRPDLTIADPICTLIFSTISVLVSLNVFIDIISVFLEATPVQFTYDEVKHSLELIDGVTEVHNLRLWSLTVGILSANVHLKIDENRRHNVVLHQATHILQEDYGVKFVCIQVENNFESWFEIHNQTSDKLPENPFIVQNASDHEDRDNS